MEEKRKELVSETKENKNKFKEWIRFLKFTLFSISAGLIQILSFTLLSGLFKMSYWPAYLIALLLSVLWNFTINRKFTFKSANNVKIAMLLVLAFYAVFTPVSTILGDLAESSGANKYIVLAVSMALNFVLEFLYTRYVVYGKSVDTAVNKKKD